YCACIHLVYMTNAIISLRDRPEPGEAAYLAAFFGQTSGEGFAFFTRGSGGVLSIRRSTSSGVGSARFSFVMAGL
ncbi:MAG: hypothetical protein AABM33_14925, partial [Pseudomonadota bacterium]